MARPAYYNENDLEAAYWLRELIHEGLIAPGDVDTRSIEDVTPQDLAGYGQCHFFAGIGGWSLAFRLAGIPDDYPAWSGSCPCQPFSASGEKRGFVDERHLWPAFDWLIDQCRPDLIFGEQVANKDAEPWLDLVLPDLESMDFAVGACAIPAAGIGAPEIRDRSWWVAHANNPRSQGWPFLPECPSQRPTWPSSLDSWLALSHRLRLGETRGDAAPPRSAGLARGRKNDRMADAVRSGRPERGPVAGEGPFTGSGSISWVADANGPITQLVARKGTGPDEAQGTGARGEPDGRSTLSGLWLSDPLNGFWAGSDWIFCRDGQWRPVEPGAFPLAHGIPARVGRLRGYGNAVIPQVAALFIRSSIEAMGA